MNVEVAPLDPFKGTAALVSRSRIAPMKLPRFLFLVALAGLISIAALRADENSDRLDIVRRARLMIDATFKGDMSAVLKFMHPGTVSMLGGEEPLKKAIGGVAEQMKQLGLEFVSMDVRPPTTFHRRGQRTFTVVMATTVMQIPAQARIIEESSMIAVRDTPAGEWRFVRVNAQLANGRTLLKSLFPDFPDDLKLEAPTTARTEPLTR